MEDRAMLSIGEFARLAAVSVRTLRHYDEIGLLPPAQVDPQTGYRYYSAGQLGQLNRIVALKELGLSLAQARQLLAGLSLDELRGMLLLRRAQLEQELAAHSGQLLEVEARLRYIAKEGAMPADDITVKKLPALGVAVITAQVPAYGPENVVPAVNRLREQFDRLEIPRLVKVAGPYMIFYDDNDGDDITVHLALPVAEPPSELPHPAAYTVLPEAEAAVAVRSGPAASIFPMVYHDLAQWAAAHGYQTSGPGREIWVSEVDDIAEVSQQVIEVQLPFTRPGPRETSPCTRC
jgi:DNA-binding transcriptional MerR regulator/effector-binding domain-containing protein